MICTVCNDTPGDVTVVALERRGGAIKELQLTLCEDCETGLTAEDWIETVGAPAEV